MSYIPKYVVKRLVPEDGIKKTDDGISISVVNVVSAIPADQIPGNPIEFIDIKVNGTALTNEEKENVSIKIDDQTLTLPNLRDAGTIPIGATVEFSFPTDAYQVGEEITIDFEVPIVNVVVNFTRTIC
jgi:hypothetical protein